MFTYQITFDSANKHNERNGFSIKRNTLELDRRATGSVFLSLGQKKLYKELYSQATCLDLKNKKRKKGLGLALSLKTDQIYMAG
jgi:hypothetical protein